MCSHGRDDGRPGSGFHLVPNLQFATAEISLSLYTIKSLTRIAHEI
jgi:hypothetical protein